MKAAALLLVVVCAPGSAIYGQHPTELVEATAVAVTHVRASLPEGEVAIDTLTSQPRGLATAVAGRLGMAPTRRRAVVQCRERRDCSLVGVAGILAIGRAMVAGDTAQVLVEASREYRLPTHSWIASQGILVRLERDAGRWRVLDAVVKWES